MGPWYEKYFSEDKQYLSPNPNQPPDVCLQKNLRVPPAFSGSVFFFKKSDPRLSTRTRFAWDYLLSEMSNKRESETEARGPDSQSQRLPPEEYIERYVPACHNAYPSMGLHEPTSHLCWLAVLRPRVEQFRVADYGMAKEGTRWARGLLTEGDNVSLHLTMASNFGRFSTTMWDEGASGQAQACDSVHGFRV